MDFDFDPDKHVAVTKEQMAVLQRGMDTMNKLWNDPKDGLEFKRKVKKVRPDWAIPEVDIVDQAAAPIAAALTGFQTTLDKVVERLDTRDKTERESTEERSLTDRLNQARKDYRLTDEGMDKVVSYMKEHNVADPLAAAARVTDLMPKTAPTTGSGYGPQAMNLFGSKTQDENWAELHKDPMAWFDREVQAVLDDPQFQAA